MKDQEYTSGFEDMPEKEEKISVPPQILEQLKTEESFNPENIKKIVELTIDDPDTKQVVLQKLNEAAHSNRKLDEKVLMQIRETLEADSSLDQDELKDMADMQKATEFTKEDLSVNKQGYLSPRQQRMLEKTKETLRRQTAFAIIAIFLPLALVIYLGRARWLDMYDPGVQQGLPYIIGTFAIYLLIAGFFLFLGHRKWRDVRSGTVSTAEGVAKKDLKMPQMVFIGDTKFYMPFQYKKFTEGKNYRVYYIKSMMYSHVILSWEFL